MVLIRCSTVAAGLMIIGHDKPLDRGINRFTKYHWSFARVLHNHFDIADFHNLIAFVLL